MYPSSKAFYKVEKEMDGVEDGWLWCKDGD
jgi:hypothetical protein